ncbi:MAG: hypothetical protein PVJ27_02665 [Candidatus Brocadiaceae bacterium]
MLSLALFGAAAVAYSRQRTLALCACGALFVPVAAGATVLVYWPISPALAALLLAGTLGVSLVGLLLYALDRLWAPFCLEMTYATMVCWLLWPLLVVVNFAGLALRGVA